MGSIQFQNIIWNPEDRSGERLIISLRLLLDEEGDAVGFNGLGKGDRSRGVASLFW
jgi:hypothetical protein